MSNKKSEIIRIIKFVLFSASAGVIQVGSAFLLYDVCGVTPKWFVSLVALVLSVVWNFTFNRKFTFKSDANVATTLILALLFYLPFTPFQTWAMYYFGDKMGANFWIIEALIMILNFVLEFLWQRFVVFRKSIDSAKKK